MAEIRCPADLADVGLGTLVAWLRGHAAALTDHRYGLVVLTREQVAARSVEMLACQRALADRALLGRWVHVCEALAAGAEVTEVAAATGLGPVELVGEVRGWADEQHRHGLISPDRHAQVLALLAEHAAGGDPR